MICLLLVSSYLFLCFWYLFFSKFSERKLRELEMENENIVFFFVFLLFFLFLCFEQIWEKKFRELKEKIINKKIFVSKEVKIFVFFFNLQYTIIDLNLLNDLLIIRIIWWAKKLIKSNIIIIINIFLKNLW